MIFFCIRQCNPIDQLGVQRNTLLNTKTVMLDHMTGQGHSSVVRIVRGEFQVAKAGHTEFQGIG